MEVREKQIFNLMDTNGRRRDVLNALRIYLEALGEIREEFPDAAWSSYPESVAQFVFYQKAVERSADVLRQHGHYDRLLEKLGPRLPAFLARSQTWEQLGLSEQDRDELDVYVEARARHYTSNLVKLGFTDEERRITEAGAAFARGATRRDELEAMLPIDDVNLIVLRQMLKLRIFSAPDEAGRRRFYAPAVMALLLLLQNRAMDGGTFLTVVQGLSPYLSPERQAFVLEHLGDPERIERLVWDENIRIPGDFLSDAPLTQDVFASHIRNQKSGRTVEIYYAFYQRLLAFREERSRAACEELLTLLREEKGILRKAFGCGRAVFAAGRGREPDLETFLRENGDHPLLCGEHFNREFYRAYERSSRADDIREYADTTERLLSAAGIWRFDPQSALAFPELLDELLDREALPVFGEMSDAEFRAWEGAGDCAFRRDLSLAQILRYEDGQTRAAVRRVEAAVGAAGAGEVRTLMRSKLSEDFRRHVEEKYPQEAVEKLLPLFSDRRNDGKIRKAVNDAASVPTIYEYIVGIAWYYLSGGDFDLYASLNLTLNADFEPVIHAGGGEGDIGAFQKGGEAAQGAPVVAGGAILVVVLKPEDFFLQILQYAVGSQVGLEEANDIGQGVGLGGGVQLSDDFAQFVYVLFDLSAVGRDGGGVVGCGDQFAFLRVPPVGEDSHGGGNLFVFLSVAKLVADRSCFPVDRRRAEFYFDCCHTILFLGFTLRS